MSKFGFDKMAAATPQIMQECMHDMAEMTQKYFADNFPKQGNDGNPWEEVQRRIPGTYTYAHATADDRKRKILYGRTGALKAATEKSLSEVSDHRFVLINNVPYAAMQNKGGINGKGAIVPARPFMIHTDALTEMQLGMLRERTGLIFKLVSHDNS